MKTILFPVLIFSYCTLFAQNEDEGELLHHISYLHKTDKKTTGLEKTTAKMKSKARLGGMGGFSSAYVIEGIKSDVVVPGEDSLQFVLTKDSNDGQGSVPDTVINGMNVSDMMNEIMDPGRNISLYKLTVEKGTRKAIMQESGGMFNPKVKDGAEKISFVVKKAKGKYFFIIPKKLKPGEYAFIDMMGGGMDQSFTAFCFRVE